MRNAYLRFLELANALTEVPTKSQVGDAEAKLLLEIIAVREMNGQAMNVTEAMMLSNVASPATLHRKLDKLIEAGFIELVFEGENRRTKFLVITGLAKKYFADMNRLMLEAIDQTTLTQ